MSSATPSPGPQYLLIVLRNWRVVAGSIAICALAGGILHLMTQEVYQSTALVLVQPPVFKSPEAREDNPLSNLMPRTLPIVTYRAIAQSKDVLNEVIQRLRLDDITIEDLEKKCRVFLTELGSRTPQYGIQYSQTLGFEVKAKRPELAASIAQTWAEVFKERADKLNEAGLGESHDLIEVMKRETKQTLESVEDELDHLNIEWNENLEKTRLTKKEEQLTEFEAQLKELDINIAKQQAILAMVREELGKEEKKERLFRAPSDDVYWLMGMHEEASPENADSAPLGLLTELLNPNYMAFREKEVLTASEAEGLTQERANLLAEMETLQKEIDDIQKRFVTKQTEKTRLTRERDALEETYKMVSHNLELSKVATLNKSSDIQIVAKAVEPQRSSGRPIYVTMSFAVLLGTLLAISYIVLRHILEQLDTRFAGEVKS